MAAQDDFERTREDPVTFFRLRAMRLAPRLGVSVADVDDAVSLVISAFGENWLNAAAEDFPESTPLPFRRHHLGGVVSTAGEEQVAEVLELATYLGRLADVRNVGSLIQGFKAQYHQTMLHAAFAARVRIVGGQQLSLEPPANGHRLGDLQFEFGGTLYRVECYRPTVKGVGEADLEAMRIAEGAIDATRAYSCPMAVAIAVNDEPTPDVRSDLLQVVKSAVDDVGARWRASGGHFPAICVIGPRGSVSVAVGLPMRAGAAPILVRADDFPYQGNDWDFCLRSALVKVTSVAGLEGGYLEGQANSCCGIWLPTKLRDFRAGHRDVSAALEKLGRAIEGKLPQTRGGGSARRNVVVDSWLTERLSGEDVGAERLRRKIVSAHPGVAGLLMVRRRWMPALGRHGYVIRTLLSDEPNLAISAEFLERLRKIDSPP